MSKQELIAELFQAYSHLHKAGYSYLADQVAKQIEELSISLCLTAAQGRISGLKGERK